MSGELRPARAEDIPQIDALLKAEWLPSYGLDEYLDTFLVIEDGGRVLGCAGLELFGEAALLRSVVVSPERRGQDDGRRLVEASLAAARDQGVSRVYLFTMNAAPFFSRMGFREIEMDAFEDAVRASRQYEVISQMPELRERLLGMSLDLPG
ncbi:MAG: GNAT family N-acetyltransferase [Dehalococcoidia bacterium]